MAHNAGERLTLCQNIFLIRLQAVFTDCRHSSVSAGFGLLIRPRKPALPPEAWLSHEYIGYCRLVFLGLLGPRPRPTLPGGSTKWLTEVWGRNTVVHV
jgi:hypothetical protein